MMQAQSIIQQQKVGNEQQQVAQAQNTIEQFAADPKHEFLGEVRDLMADLIAAGKANNLEDAYHSAIWATPETRKILLQRESEARVTAKTNRAGAARRASLSVNGAPRGAGAGGIGNPNLSLRETIAAAIDAQDS